MEVDYESLVIRASVPWQSVYREEIVERHTTDSPEDIDSASTTAPMRAKSAATAFLAEDRTRNEAVQKSLTWKGWLRCCALKNRMPRFAWSSG